MCHRACLKISFRQKNLTFDGGAGHGSIYFKIKSGFCLNLFYLIVSYVTIIMFQGPIV